MIVVCVGLAAVTRFADRAGATESQADMLTSASQESVTAPQPQAAANRSVIAEPSKSFAGESATAESPESVTGSGAQDSEATHRAVAARLRFEETHASHVKLIEEVEVARAELLALTERSLVNKKSLAEARARALKDEGVGSLFEDVQKLRAQLTTALNGAPEVVGLLEKRDGLESELGEVEASSKALRLTLQKEGISDASRQAMLKSAARATTLQRDLSRLNEEIRSTHVSVREAGDDTRKLHASIVEAERHLEDRIKRQPDVLALETELEQISTQRRERTQQLSDLNTRIRNLDCCKPTS